MSVESGFDIGEAIEARKAIVEGVAFLTLARSKLAACNLMLAVYAIDEAERRALQYKTMYENKLPSKKIEDFNIEELERLVKSVEKDVLSEIKYCEELKDELARRRNG